MIATHTLSNGLTVLVEEMSHVESAAYDLVVPGGLICDSPGTVGSSQILAELLGRGAGPYNSRQLSETFDGLGIRHGEGVGLDKFGLSAVLVADKLKQGLELLGHMVLEPHLNAEEIPPIQSILLQDLASLNDNPARRAGVELTQRYYPAPFNRSSLGEEQGIRITNQATVREQHQRYFRPDTAILSIAGNVRTQEVLETVTTIFGGWSGTSEKTPMIGTMPKNDYFHIPVESAQVQIMVAAPSVQFGDPTYYSGKIAVSMLGSSMFGRLFMELREKRGLCYSVQLRHGANRHYGTVTGYVGTTPERAQESLDLFAGELQGLSATMTQDELNRTRVNLKAALVIGEESPGSRASSNATDWWLMRRVRTLQEISAEIDKVTIDSIQQFLKAHRFFPCSILTLGSRALHVPQGVTG